MPTYKAPVADVMFLLNDVFHIDRYNNLPGFADATPDLLEAVLDEAAKFCEDVLTPLNRVGDKEGCKRHPDGSVTTPTGFKDAYKRLTEGGWIGRMSLPLANITAQRPLPRFWKVGCGRYDYSPAADGTMQPVISNTAPLTVARFHRLHEFDVLDFGQA